MAALEVRVIKFSSWWLRPNVWLTSGDTAVVETILTMALRPQHSPPYAAYKRQTGGDSVFGW